MATRVSGTTSLSPISGSISTPDNGTSINQTINDVSVVASSGTVTISAATSTNITSPVTNINSTLTNFSGASAKFLSTAQSYNSTGSGAVQVAGGVSIGKDLWVGGIIHGRIANADTSTTASSVVVINTNTDGIFYPIFTDTDGLIVKGSTLYADSKKYNNTIGGLTYNPSTGKLTTENLFVDSTTTSISPTTGAFTVTGGVGILGDVYVNQNVIPGNDLTSNLGDIDARWATSYLDTIYGKILTSTASDNISIVPGAGVADVFGDIRVRGTNPIGTAPVVTNTLYVTVDGDDTNDGRAQDASRACRTITGAVNSPYYQAGTQILVSAGFYLEDNPIEMKPYTSIRGSDIRTTFIEPINKTQDLFHVNSGCYLNYMTFINGRSGLLPGSYAPGFNRGAFATAFPPQTGDNRIDLFHSPYIQNCTNQSGPWLNDGTMYLPSQTVQVPAAVGTGTWAANTTSIVVNITTGTVARGMSINAGQQNPGFFNARTLLLANKPFLQEQTVKYINNLINANISNPASIWYRFTYSQELCFRDVGILVENVAYDMAFGGNEKSVESGLAYYNGVVSLIAGQEQQTSVAINYLATLVKQVVVNQVCTDLYSGTGKYQQVRNTALIGGGITTSTTDSLFGIITGIINSGTNYAPSVYKSTGPDAAFVSAEILMQANRAFIQENTINYINWNLVQPQPQYYLPYNKIKCLRDTKLIIDSLALDLLYPTTSTSQTTFSGLQYWSQDSYTSTFASELTTTTNAITYLRDLSSKIVQNITTSTDLIPRYSTGTQRILLEPATGVEAGILVEKYNIIISILNGNNKGWSDKIIPNGNQSNLAATINAYNLLLDNLSYMQDEVIAYIDATKNPGFNYDRTVCRRDLGYIIKSVAFDLLHGGNRQSVQSGLSYYSFNGSNTVIPKESTATINAFTFLNSLIAAVLTIPDVLSGPQQTKVKQVVGLPLASASEVSSISSYINILNTIIGSGPTGYSPSLINTTASNTATVINAYNIIVSNKEFLAAEVIAYLDNAYNVGAFSYDQAKCSRDTGLLVDAVSQDILLGGNQKSLEAGLSYWNAGYNYIAGQLSTTTAAINYIRDISLKIIANQTVDVVTGTNTKQVINNFFKYGGDYMPQQAVTRNFGIITTIINSGPTMAPPSYAGGGLFALTGLNGSAVKLAPTVTSVNTLSATQYRIGLSTSTVGFGNNSTLYFGDVTVQPLQDDAVELLSVRYTGTSTTWNSRKLDPIGGMGGSLVDGAVISDKSPIQSFVYDAFTQLTQGGRGVYITNNGYAQLVSVFTIFSSVGVQVDNGGIASIVNSNANFGDLCLVAKGFGRREFSGTVYNPAYTAYPSTPGPDGFNQFYPNGYWPYRGTVEVFLPDTADRPHISLVMEVIPPTGHVNDQGFPGYLNAQPSLAVLSSGTVTITGIDTSDIAIGNSVYIRDINGFTTSTSKDSYGNWIQYAATGTYVTDLGYNSVTLNQALTASGGDITNPNYFTLYFCGNAYYTVLSSTVATNPKPVNANILSTASLQYQDPFTGVTVNPPGQITQHIAALQYLNTLVDKVIANVKQTPVYQSTITQTTSTQILNGVLAKTFIDQRFSNMIGIIGAANITAANNVVPPTAVKKTGTPPQGAGSAISLIQLNEEFLAAEVGAYVRSPTGLNFTNYNQTKCNRDTKLILERLIYDIQSGGTYNSVMSGLSYWSRNGTHHIIELGEAVTDTNLFEDGVTVNFYQRSYISASGYVFEYVGAGTNYGALPQVGRADPVQSKETLQLGSGKVFFTSTDQNGDFRIGPGLVISQATGVLSGRTFTKSLYANLTPFILAITGA